MEKILTPEEFIIRFVNEHPALFASSSYDETKFRIFDHVFNVIGNGLTTKHFMGKPLTQCEIETAQKWFSCKRAGYGYTKIIETLYRGKTIVVADPDANEQPIVAPIQDFNKYPNVMHWIKFECDQGKIPYPNFKKPYSMIWDNRQIEFSSLGNDWNNAAIWFYKKCHNFFLDDSLVSQYSYAFPSENAIRDKKSIEGLKNYLSFERYPTNDDITNAYHCEFIGDRNNDTDLFAFAVRRWKQELQKHCFFLMRHLTN